MLLFTFLVETNSTCPTIKQQQQQKEQRRGFTITKEHELSSITIIVVC
jgi:hypothetical protein